MKKNNQFCACVIGEGYVFLKHSVWITLSYGQAVVGRGFFVNKEAPNLQEMSFRALRLIHRSLSAKKNTVADFQISEELLTSCNHVSNRWRNVFEEGNRKGTYSEREKKKSSRGGTWISKEEERRAGSVAEKLIDTAVDKKAKKAEKQKNASQMKALLME